MGDVLMPRLSDTMEEGTVTRWLKQPGDGVTKGDVIAEIQTDKANMDLESYEDGTLDRLLVEEGATVPIGEPIAVISAADTLPAPTTLARREPAARRWPLITSPLARSLATRNGIDLAEIRGSGPGGRVIRADVEEAIAQKDRAVARSRPSPEQAMVPRVAAAEAQTPAAHVDEEFPLNQVRRLTAERLTQSARAPHFYLTIVVDAAPLLRLRSDINAAGGTDAQKLTVTDLLVKACAKTLRSHPDMNASWGDGVLVRHHMVHIGVAVATPEGLVVPVLHDADTKTLEDIAAQSRSLAGLAREGRLSLDQLTGGTFTISNLGMFGIDHFTAIINPPQAAILAVGAATPQPVVRGGKVVAGTTMKLTLSIDHRVLDGAAGASFLHDLGSLLENPIRILL